MSTQTIVEWIGRAIDLAGVAVIAAGILLSFVIYAMRIARSEDRSTAYRELRQTIGRSVLLGLELLVAGDIIRTVAIAPSFTSVGVLAAIVAIRTFLSTTLEMEISGHWPWQRESEPAASRAELDRPDESAGRPRT